MSLVFKKKEIAFSTFNTTYDDLVTKHSENQLGVKSWSELKRSQPSD